MNVTREHQVVLANNAITGNGTASGATGGRFGVTREGASTPNPAGIQLRNNLVCGNRLGEINGPALDATDSGNLTPTGTEGPGVAASPGCDNAATVYANVNGADNLANTADDNFTPAAGSPLIDAGLDPRTLGLPASVNPLLEADYLAEAVRPRAGTEGQAAQFDIGALELGPPDTQGPTVVFQQPPTNSHVRQTVTVQAQATDSTNVATLTLQAGSQSLTTTLNPSPPAPPITGTASWTTTSVSDGTHTLTATATDQAANSGSASRVVIVDNTPPDTTITGGPTGEITTSSTSFTFTGTDNLTPVGSLVFAWRLDGGAYSAFSATTTATLTGLLEGPHTFDVKARDLAGNEDATPASRGFSVRFGPSLSTVDPATGPIGTLVTLTGTGFVPGGTTVTFNGLPAVLRTLTATQLTTTVPIGATTGPLVVSTAQGSTSIAFTVTLTGDFTLTAAPAAPTTIRVVAGDQGSAQISAAGTGSFTSLVSLSVSAGPAGITPTLLQPAVAPGGGATAVRFGVAATVAAGTYAFTVTGQAQVDGQLQTRTAGISLEVLAATTPAITGQVLTAEAVPVGIPSVTVTLGSAFTLTDTAGNFTLLAPPPGPNMLLVDGRTASTPTAQYPPVEIQINVAATGPTRVPFPLYLPKLDTAHPITLPLDGNGFTTQEVLATTPLIPGLVVTIPQGTKITGPDGNPVSQITITPVPVDRSPMPFPAGVTLPLLFTIQPGGAVPSQPLPIAFPNVANEPVGSQANLWFFDLVAGAWQTWGTGTVSADGTQIVSDPGFGLPRFAWHGAARVSLSDEVRTRQANRAMGGEPVDLPTGRFVASKTDLVLPGRLPVTIQRMYRSESQQAGLLGNGWALEPYETLLLAQGTSLVLIYPDQSRAVFAPTGTGTWQNTTEPEFQGAVLTQLPGDFLFQLRLKDGTLQRYDRIFGFGNLAGLAAITDRNGNTVTLTREAVFQQNRITQITEPAGRALTLAYDPSGRLTTITDPIGRTVQYGYDAQGRLETVTDPAGGLTRYTYDGSHRILTITDPRTITFLTNEYDANGRVTRQTQADGGIWQFAYELTGVIVTKTTVTDPRGNPTTYRFDARGNTLAQTDALGQTTSFEYANGSNRLLSTTDPLGRITRYEYDAQANVTRIIDPAGNPRSFTYESTFNRLTSLTDALNQATSLEYDPTGNLTAVVDPLNNRTTLGYNGVGQVTSTTDPLNHTTTLTYDSVGNLTTIADALGNTTRRVYDAVSRLTQQIDARGMATSLAYDALNRTTQILDTLNGLTQFTYDPNGNLLTVTDARNSVMTYSYDSMDRLQTRTDPVNVTESFQYDGVSNLTGHTDRKGQVATFSYDGLNRRSGGVYADSATTFSYDAVGRLVQATDSQGSAIDHVYDTLDRLTRQTGPLGTVSYQYDALGRRTTMTTGGQSPVSYSWDPASRLTQIGQGSQVVTLQYDAAGRRIQLTLPNQVATTYQYDPASRLTALSYQNAAGLLGDLSYTYDAAGNRTGIGGSFARTLLPDAVSSATYDAANRQLTFGGQSVTYDANGNLTSDPANTYTWDARNRLTALTGPTPASFQYDGLGRRTQKTINAVTTRYQYDGLNPVFEVPDSGLTVALLTGLTVDEYLTRTDATGLQGLLVDALGSTLALTDATGTVATSYSYELFGRSEVTGATSENVLQCTGRENDGTGLYYYRARYYHPQLQRFISEDPIGFLGQDVNLYAYVTNSPLRFRDPWGLLNFLAGVGGSAVGVTGVEGSGGIVFNPGGGSQPTDVGVFGSAGIGAGLNIGADAFVGFIAGGIENVSGKTVNTNLVFGPASLTIIGDPNTGKFIGFTFGVGPTVPIPFQASLTGAVTGTFTVRDLLRSLSPSRAEASMSPAAVPVSPSASPPSLAGRK